MAELRIDIEASAQKIISRIEERFGIPAERLLELAQADRDGRCVVFKFGIGSTVYRLWVRPNGSHPFVSEEKLNTVKDLIHAESWADAYSTREAAEAALKEICHQK